MADHQQQRSFFSQAQNRERWMLDLPLANKLQFLNKGILPEHIVSADLCTSCRKDLFFSHRREAGQTGRQLNFIMLCRTAAEGIS
jgi:copper oxidase (laccase) domain-containing protein